ILRLDKACRDLEEGRFAGTIAPDKRDLLACRSRKFRTVQQGRAAKGKLDAVKRKKWRSHGSHTEIGNGMGDQQCAATLEADDKVAGNFIGQGQGGPEGNRARGERPLGSLHRKTSEVGEGEDAEKRAIAIV